MKAEKVLEIFKGTGSLLEGHFELRSGLHSDRYFQCAILLSHPRVAAELCAALAVKVRDGIRGAERVEAVIAPAMGGIVVGHEVARSLGVRSIFAEKKEGFLELRRFKIRKGAEYIIAEDVVTRGGRVQETIDIVVKEGGRPVAVCLLVDRSGGKVKFDYPTFSLLEIEPVTYEPGKCPLCEEKVPVIHPGS